MSGVRQTLDLSQEQIGDLVEAFKGVDTDGSGAIDASELGYALEVCGLKVPSCEVRQLIQEFDNKIKDDKIDFDEFRQLYARLKSEKDFGIRFKKAVTARKDVQTHGGTSQASVEGTTHSVREAETKAFTDWINRALENDEDCKAKLPLKVDSNDLFDCCNNGILLCKLINCSVSDTIDDRAINKTNLSVYRRSENHNLALNSAQSIGCNIVNIGPEDLEKGRPHLVLGLLWQIIRIGLLSDINLSHHPGLVHLLEEGETIEDLMRLSPEQILIRWVNYHLRNAGLNRQINNFGKDIMDSEAYAHLLHQIAPRDKGVHTGCMSEDDRTKRAELMLQEAEKIECRSFVGPHDVVTGNTKLNLAFVANLFNTYPALEGVNEEDLDLVDETREEKTYRNWMNSMGVNPFVHWLYNDLRDGSIIFQLYEIIKPGSVEWKRVVKNFHKLKINFEKLENCNYAVELGRDKLKFSLVGIGGSDVLEGNQTLTLALVWQLMRAYTLAMLTKLTGSGHPILEKEIVQWAQQKLTSCGKKSSFTSFQDQVLADGKVIIDLIDSIKCNMINYELIKHGSSEEERMANAKYAISMARKIGAKVYALPEDIVEVKPKMIMTIFACLMMRDFPNQKPVDDDGIPCP